MVFIINKEVETVQNIQSCMFSFKQLNCDFINYRDASGTHTCVSLRVSVFDYGPPWPAVYINFVLKIHQIQVLTEPLCRAKASFYALPNNERGTKYRGLTYSARQNCP